jgi:hypothetical protein
MRVSTVSIVCVSVLCFAISPADSAAHLTTIRGRLLQTVKGVELPIPGKRITLTDGRKTYPDTYSGFDGSYSLSNIPAQDYLLGVWFSAKTPTSFIIHASGQQYTDLGDIAPDNARLNDALRRDLLQILQAPSKSVYMAGSIPGQKETYARRSTLAPRSETLLALIDATITGTAEDCILFTERGIYYHTDLYSPARGFIRYEDFPSREFRKTGVLQISLGDHQPFDTSGLDLGFVGLVSILQQIQGRVATLAAELRRGEPK